MIYTEMTQRAMCICYKAHRGMHDKGGVPYVFHPMYVASQIRDDEILAEEKICAALLHDVIEDTRWTMEDLRKEGFSEAVLKALELLTHDNSVPYLEYVKNLKDDPIAARVKLADLRHNSIAGRMPHREERDYLRLQKYLRAQAILTGGAADLKKMCLYVQENGKTLTYAPDGTILDGTILASRDDERQD